MSYMFVKPEPVMVPCGKCATPTDATSMIEAFGAASGRFGDGYGLISESWCLSCWHSRGIKPVEPQPKPKQTLPYKTLADATARAEKIAAHFGRPQADIWGNADIGYRIFGDSPLVPGFKNYDI